MWIVLVYALMVAAGAIQGTEEDSLLVTIAQGTLRGHKASNYDVFEFINVPYASAPTGVDRFKAPLPPPVWTGTHDAIDRRIICPQDGNLFGSLADMDMQEDCLVANIHVPNTNQTNLPVLVSAHGGAFLFGWGYYDKRNGFAASKNIIVVNFNYRLGAHGFLCLGIEDAPGNAGMKDHVALLRWVQNNIADFGGNPDDVTITGCSAGSSSVDLLQLSSMTDGLFHRVIVESACTLNPFSTQLNPLRNARNHAQNLGFTNVTDLNALAEFYKTTRILDLTDESMFHDSKDSYITFTPCVEKNIGQQRFLEDAPINILRSGNFKKLPVIYGYTKHEGMYRLPNFPRWSRAMNENFAEFLPADLHFENDEEKFEVAKQVQEFYFGNKLVNESTVLKYVDYFTDVSFLSGILRNIALRVNAGHSEIYLYEYSFTYNGSGTIPYTNGKRGADHCDQYGLLLDHSAPESLPEDRIAMELTMSQIMYNFITTGNPTPPGSDSSLPTWPPVGHKRSPHYSVGSTIQVAGIPTEDRAIFWDDIYERYGATPQPPIDINEDPTSPPESTEIETDEEPTTTPEPNSATLKSFFPLHFWILHVVISVTFFKSTFRC